MTITSGTQPSVRSSRACATVARVIVVVFASALTEPGSLAAAPQEKKTQDAKPVADAPPTDRPRSEAPEARGETAAPAGEPRSAGGLGSTRDANADGRGKGSKQGAAVPSRRARLRRTADDEPLPQRIALPRAGVYPAPLLVELAGRLGGHPTRIENAAVRDREIYIAPGVAGREFTLEELKVLLAVHRVYLFREEHEKRGVTFVATTNPAWEPREPRYTTILTISAEQFRRVNETIQRAVEKYNAKRGEKGPHIRAVPVESLGKIFVRAPKQRLIEQLEKLVAERDHPDPNRPRLFSYIGVVRPVKQLRDAALGELTPAERERVNIVLMKRGNRMLFRAPAKLGEHVRALLEKHDRRRVSVR